MSEFVARVGTPDGLVVEQRHQAATDEALRRELENRGLHVFSVKPVRGLSRLSLRRRQKISHLDFLVFNQQLATLLRAGIPVLQSLELLQRAQSKPFLRSILERVLEEVRGGAALSEAFSLQGDLFPKLYSASLLAGERSGELVSVLDRYIHYQELMGSIRRKVSSALTYPVVLMGLAFGLITLLITYVIPRFASFYAGFGTELPFITRAILGFAQAVQDNILIIVGVILVGVVLVGRWAKTERGRVALDRLRLKIPFVGEIFHLLALSQFIRSLGTLVAGGTPLVNSLEISTGTVTNRAVSSVLGRVAPRVREGQALWSSLERTQLFPELSIAMVQVGEATGALEGMLLNVSQFYDETIEVRLARVVTLIEPAVLVLMGGVVAMLLLSVYYPMFTMINRV